MLPQSFDTLQRIVRCSVYTFTKRCTSKLILEDYAKSIAPAISEFTVDEYNYHGHVPFNDIIKSHFEIILITYILIRILDYLDSRDSKNDII